MQAEDVLFICILSSKQRPERQVGNGEKQPCRLVKYYCRYEYGIIVFVSGNICTCVHRTTFYEIMSITTIKHATESITLNIVSLLSMLMCLSNDISHHNPSQLAILPGNTFSILI
ncbi:hypothetical protein NP493_130g00000 [Ridgeia piscesae]|uniref:Uncharacterized protein n=1 Tax=Ridgeia piscesae TaxID=27915 RepID=A0AAD9P5F0_RIDPI|nr:hypothetical protein NP493_130g00000 [Ridgeia piscesae]